MRGSTLRKDLPDFRQMMGIIIQLKEVQRFLLGFEGKEVRDHDEEVHKIGQKMEEVFADLMCTALHFLGNEGIEFHNLAEPIDMAVVTEDD